MATILYTGDGNTANWSDAANWKGGTAPGVSDTALLLGGPDSTVTSPVAVNNLMVLSSQSVTFDGAVTTYGLGDCKGLMVCVGGTVTFAPGSSLADGGVLQAGIKSVGTFVAKGTQADPTVLQAERTELGKLATGTGYMTIDGASLTMTAGLTVGEAGKGTLTITDGGQVTAAHMTVGLDAGASGQVVMSGPSSLTVTGYAAVGGEVDHAAGGAGSVTVGAGSLFQADAGLHVSAGSTITLAGGTVSAGDVKDWLSIAPGASVSGAGVLTTRTGGGFDVNGTLSVAGGTLDVQGRVAGSGSLAIGDGATMQVDGKAIMLPRISFAGADGTLALAQGATVTSEIDGFTAGDAISMAGVTGASWNGVTDLLTLTGGGHTVDRLHLGGSFAANQFVVTQQNGVGVVSLHG